MFIASAPGGVKATLNLQKMFVKSIQGQSAVKPGTVRSFVQSWN